MEHTIFNIFHDTTDREADIKYEECHRREKFSDCKAKEFLYGAAGGFFFSPVFSSHIRYTWYGITVGPCASFLVLLEYLVIRNLIVGNKDYATFSSIMCLTGLFGGLFLIGIIVLITLHFQKNLEWGIFQNEARQVEIEYLKARRDSKSLNNVILFIYISCNILYMLALTGHIMLALDGVTDGEELSNPKWQFLPNPWKSYIKTEVDFIYFSTVLFVPYFLIMNMGILDALFPIILIGEYYWSIHLLWARMEQFSKESIITFENLHEKLERIDENGHMQVSDFVQQWEAESERLTENIQAAIKVYQRQFKKIQEIQPYMEIKFMFGMIAIIATMFTGISGLYSDRFTPIEKLLPLVISICLMFTWFCYCYPGKIFSDMGDTMIQEVYNLPWYHLNPTGRQVVYIFLCKVQEPIVFQAVGIYEAGMPIYIQILKLCYTYFNFLRLNVK